MTRMSIANAARVSVVIGAVVLCAASAQKQQPGARGGGGAVAPNAGYGATQKTIVVTDLRPRFEWPATQGAVYRVVLWRLPIRGGQRVALVDQQNFADKSWSPGADIEFGHRYELYIYNAQQQVVSSWGFTLGFQPPLIISPGPSATVRNLSPEIRIAPLAYTYVHYIFELSETKDFAKLVEHGAVTRDAVQTFPGKDGQPSTADDVRYVEYPIRHVLKSNQTYHYRVRGYFFRKDDLSAQPDLARAIGSSWNVGEFTIPAQAGNDALANIAQVTRDPAASWMPAYSRKSGLAYVLALADGGSEIRLATATTKTGMPVFEPGRDELTKSFGGSADRNPQWDVDGEGLYFDSNRTNKISNIWYTKRRGARGVTQLTFHAKGASVPTPSRDGSKIAYQAIAEGGHTAIYVMDRDGRASTELGPGAHPQWSPDGTKIAFTLRDAGGLDQLWVMDAGGGNRIQITNEYNNSQPAWHPSSKRLAFVSDRAGNADIWMADADGSRAVQLTGYQGADTSPKFTPDGKYLLFASTRDGEVMHLWIGDVSSGGAAP
jgi:Tol biopolymer transport system component